MRGKEDTPLYHLDLTGGGRGGSVGGGTMRCDDPGGLCAAELCKGSDQMREGEGDTRQKGEEWTGSVTAQSSALFLFTGCTTAPPNRIGLQPPRWRRQKWCSSCVCSASSATREVEGTHAWQRRGGAHRRWVTHLSCLPHQRWIPLVAKANRARTTTPSFSFRKRSF